MVGTTLASCLAEEAVCLELYLKYLFIKKFTLSSIKIIFVINVLRGGILK